MNTDEIIALAKDTVIKWYAENRVFIGTEDVFLVWFSKTLQHCKMCLGANIPDVTYFEFTYHGDRKIGYFDVYTKTDKWIVKKGGTDE